MNKNQINEIYVNGLGTARFNKDKEYFKKMVVFKVKEEDDSIRYYPEVELQRSDDILDKFTVYLKEIENKTNPLEFLCECGELLTPFSTILYDNGLKCEYKCYDCGKSFSQVVTFPLEDSL